MNQREHQPTFDPGIYPDIPESVYHASAGVSKSQLDLLHKAPALIEWSRNAPRDEEAHSAVDFGKAMHALLLEPDQFANRYIADFTAPPGTIVTTDDARARLDALGVAYANKDTKQSLIAKLLDFEPDAPVLDRLRAEWSLQASGKIVLTREEMRKMMLMRESVMAHPFARKLIEAPGQTEVSMYYTDRETGELVRCRLDKRCDLGNGVRVNLDVKMTEDPDDFWRSVEEYRYEVQDAAYTTATEELTGESCPFVFIAIGSKRNAGRFPVRTFVLPDWKRQEGRLAFRADLDTYHRCKTSGSWPGIEVLAPPPWRAKQREST